MKLRQIRKIGRSLGITIPFELCGEKLKDGTYVNIEQTEKGITLIPVEVSEVRPKN